MDLLLLRHKAVQKVWPVTSDVSLEIRQGFLTVGTGALLLVEKDGQGTKEREVARATGFADLASILVLGSVAPVVLAIFNRPVVANESQDARGRSFLGTKGGEAVNHFFLCFEDLSFAHDLANAFHAEKLLGSGQSERGRIGGQGADGTLLDPAVLFINRAGLRGEICQ